MSTRAVYTFKDKDATFHVYGHCDGYPSGAADKIKNALKIAWQIPRFESADFAAAFIAANKTNGGGNIYFSKGPHKHGDLEYCYTITFDKVKGCISVEAFEVDYVGAGCLLIHRDVLNSLQPLSPRCRWFEWRCDRTDLPHLERTSEDFTFCKHARNHGYKIYVDTGIQCRHAGFGESGIGGTFKPLEIKA